MKNTEYCNKVRKEREDASQRHDTLLQKNEELREPKKMNQKIVETIVERLEEQIEVTKDEVKRDRVSLHHNMQSLVEKMEQDTECETNLFNQLQHLSSYLNSLMASEAKLIQQHQSLKTVQWTQKEMEKEEE